MTGEIQYKDNGVHINFHGVISSQDIMDANTELINHPDFKSLHYQLWILDPVEKFNITADELKIVAQQDLVASGLNPRLKACIVSSSPLAYGVGRMWQAFYGDGPWKIKIFHTIEEAKVWITL